LHTEEGADHQAVRHHHQGPGRRRTLAHDEVEGFVHTL
jgi:hypothetical protein